MALFVTVSRKRKKAPSDSDVKSQTARCPPKRAMTQLSQPCRSGSRSSINILSSAINSSAVVGDDPGSCDVCN